MRKAFVAAVVVSIVLSSAALAQNTDIEALAGIQFNFANPGARSLAMGGAFLGLADDASAAEANPAGLTILKDPEISFEGRNFQNFASVNSSGTFPDVVPESFSSFSRRVEPAFASIVIPVKKFAFAAYYHQTLNYTNAVSVLPQFDSLGQVTRQVPNFFVPRAQNRGTATPVGAEECARQQANDPLSCQEFRLIPFISAVSVNMKTWGVAGAWKKGNLSLGVGARYQTFNEGAFTSRFFFDDFGGAQPGPTLVQATGLTGGGEIGEETDITFTAGFKWAIRDNLSIGGVVKQGAEFDAPAFILLDADADFIPIADSKFHIPDIAGLGFSYKPAKLGTRELNQALTISADAVFVKYSNLTDDFRATKGGTEFLQNGFEAEDAIEVHVGGEYFLSTKIPLAVRVGYWRDPAHSIRYTGPITCDDPNYVPEDRAGCQINRIATSILLPGGEDLNHLSVGVGLAWPKFQIDAAYDTSDTFKVGSLSFVKRF